MLSSLNTLNPILLALLGTLFTWALTALGAATVFLGRGLKPKTFDGTLGFASGVMIAASFWSLLAPSIAMSEDLGYGALKWVPALAGFLLGGLFLWAVDKVLPHLHPGFTSSETEGIRTSWQRSVLLVLAITLHNIPEGLAVGVAFGAAAFGLPSATLGGAIALAIGIGLQNLPEGMAVAFPLRREGMAVGKAFWYGQLSGFVEPIAGVIGAYAVVQARPLLPYALAFAAGAMIFVVVEELIPESQRGGNTDFATIGAILGFAVMMFLDVSLG
ncbi:MAG: ZIP family metal transporter [Candidatus Aureabacteria bacterium]|nr:ZIP family metal transporter [Candidatus Auribacterota bacterium]